jgi:hypothetical protein
MTSGSQHSLIVSPAVVWGQKITPIPDLILLSPRLVSTKRVIFTNSQRFLLEISIVSIFLASHF